MSSRPRLAWGVPASGSSPVGWHTLLEQLRLGEDAHRLAHAVADRAREGTARDHLVGQPHPGRVAVALRAARVSRVSPVFVHVLLPLELHWEHISLIYLKYMSDILICILLG